MRNVTPDGASKTGAPLIAWEAGLGRLQSNDPNDAKRWQTEPMVGSDTGPCKTMDGKPYTNSLRNLARYGVARAVTRG